MSVWGGGGGAAKYGKSTGLGIITQWKNGCFKIKFASWTLCVLAVDHCLSEELEKRMQDVKDQLSKQHQGQNTCQDG